MSQSQPNLVSTPFPSGATWVRADFHLHTIKEPGASRKDYRAEFKDRENDFPREFIQRLKQEEVRAGVITNHNSFDFAEYKSLAKQARAGGILLLPGVELGVRDGDSSIHTLIAFDPETLSADNNFIARFLHGQFPRGNPQEGDATTDDLAGCLEKLEGLGVQYFVVFAHVDSDNGFFRTVNKTELTPIYNRIKDIWDNRVLGLQNPKAPEGVDDYLKWAKQKLPDGMPVPALVAGSDPMTIADVAASARGLCHLKISDLTFHSVQFALKDHFLRVSPDKPVGKKRPVIRTLEIDGGRRRYAAYQLSTELTTLIGSRGSGKSLMIETLRWGLGIESGEGDRAYKKDLIHAFLDKGAVVKIKGENGYGDKVIVTRAYTERTSPSPPQVFINEKQSRLDVNQVFPGLLYFGQKDLGARQENFYEQFFSQVLGAYPEQLAEAGQHALRAFERSIDNYLIATKAKSEDDQHRYEQENLKKQLDAFKERGVEQQLKDITAFDQDVRRFGRFRKQYAESFSCIENEVGEWRGAFPVEPVFKASANAAFNTELDGLKSAHNKTASLFEQGMKDAAAIRAAIDGIHGRLETRRMELQGQFAAILRDLNMPDLDIDAYRKMVSRHEQLVEIRKLTEERGGKLGQFERDLLAAGETWHKARQAITHFYQGKIDEVNARLPANIRIGIRFQGDKDSFRQFLESIFRGSRFDETSYDALLAACDSGLDLFKRKTQIIQSELSQRMGEIFSGKLSERFKGILTFSPKDARTINYDNVSINELSLGKRAMALLLLLLSLENHPIIILDQPEDDLDNETIHRLVVKPLLKKKTDIQFIIATHNPNLPVLGDAEQVIACHESSRGHYGEDTGSLDRESTKNAIVNIMEGGKEAFAKRHDIYTLWKKSN
ncbi:MAG: AAA family ATPase [Opitutaceae bacterium]|jgi:predicted ATPase|nr:AAA family ATPase [Opitutaceae bacterium]